MIARVCWYLPSGEFERSTDLELEPLPRGSGATYRATVPANLGVCEGWRAIVNGSQACRVTSALPAGGAAVLLLTRTASTATA